MIRIALSGKARSGKDYLASRIQEELEKENISVQLLSIAEPLKVEYCRDHQISLEELELNKEQYRKGLIDLGNLRRSEDSQYWLNKLVDRINPRTQVVIVRDMRLKTEFEYFKHFKFRVIRVQCSEDVRISRNQGKGFENSLDLTETDLDDITGWDYIIQNDSDSEFLQQSAKLISNIEMETHNARIQHYSR